MPGEAIMLAMQQAAPPTCNAWVPIVLALFFAVIVTAASLMSSKRGHQD